MSDVTETTTEVETTTEDNGPIDYTYANDKPATPLQRRFAEWLQGPEVGYDPETAETKADAFAEGVRYAVALRIPYQASDHNRSATAQERVERQAEQERKRQERAAAALAKAEAAAKAAQAKAEEAPAETTTTTPAPTPAAAPAAKRAPARKPAAGTTAAPF